MRFDRPMAMLRVMNDHRTTTFDPVCLALPLGRHQPREGDADRTRAPRPPAPAPVPGRMNAVTYRRYGGPEVLEYGERPRPAPGRGDVLVAVRAASINAADYRMMRADPFLVRLANGLRRPVKMQVLGADVAGVVAAVGDGVTGVAVGDRVMGCAPAHTRAAFAEYACLPQTALVTMPDGMAFVDAAAVPLAGIAALQAIRDRARVRPGQSVLVHGAGGGVGTLTVQIAVAMGARVSAVCGPRSVELVASLGASRVIDYSEQDFADESASYDVILGVNGYRSLAEYRRALNPGGRYVMIGGTNRQIFEALLLGRLRFLFRGKTADVVTIDDSLRATDLRQLRDFLVGGQIRPVIDRTFALGDVAAAMRYVEGGHVAGKVVLTVSPAA